MAKLKQIETERIPVFVTAKKFCEITGKSLREVKRLCQEKNFPATYKGSYYEIHYKKALEYIERQVFETPVISKKFDSPKTAEEMKALLFA